jgi:hypothetical protein
VLWDFDTAKLTELNLANTVNQADILYLVQDGGSLQVIVATLFQAFQAWRGWRTPD